MTTKAVLYVVDDEAIVRASIISLVQAHGDFECREYSNGDDFLADLDGLAPGCVVLDLQLDGASGETVMEVLAQRISVFRTIVITGFGDFSAAIEAFRAGAVDFLYKPYEMRPLLNAIDRAFHLLDHGVEPPDLVADAKARLARLSPIEQEVLARLIGGQTNQDIAKTLQLEPRTVQVHRARALAAIEAASVLAAVRTAAIAGWTGAAPGAA
ncbi:response regulator receiver protein [Sphingomonas sp. Root710]|uniref:response regulator transcription factor n=1 Tax=Sphingomonas sp. Root710 TaxID=1736594 RepID=UPI0006F8A13C|nr:response regulator [Sphingomonas sp. Root710]KRB79308.1 response regulator receiver protein [Sphingomonas sp. Root710]